MPKVYENIARSLDRADALLSELLREYEASLARKTVSGDATERTHDICQKLRDILDRTARRYWEKHVSASLSDDARDKAKVYFPITQTQAAFDSMMGKWQWKEVRSDHQAIYEYLMKLQPFGSGDNPWLLILDDLAIQGKHIDLLPQTKIEERRVTVERHSPGGAMSVSWNPEMVRFGGAPGVSVQVVGAPIDPRTQRVVPTPGVTERIETWVSFVIDGHGVNAAIFCKQACEKVRQIVTDMNERFDLS